MTLGWKWHEQTYGKEKESLVQSWRYLTEIKKGLTSRLWEGLGVHEQKQDHSGAPHPISAECSSVFLSLALALALSSTGIIFSVPMTVKHNNRIIFQGQILKCRLILWMAYVGTLILDHNLCSGVSTPTLTATRWPDKGQKGRGWLW